MDDLKGLHNCLLNLMVEIDKICQENNICIFENLTVTQKTQIKQYGEHGANKYST